MTKSDLRKVTLIFMSPLIIFSFRQTALAHRVIILAWEKDGVVYTHSKFSGGEAIKQGRIKVFDSSGDLLLKGASDDHGEFSFKPSRIAPLTLVLRHGGHRAEWNLKPEQKHAHKPVDKRPPGQSDKAPDNSKLNREDIRLIVEKALDKKLDPVFKTLAEQSVSHVAFKDIIGGLGYILGLLGLAAYFQYRKK